MSTHDPITDDEPTVRGDLLRPGDEGYDEARTIWNGMIDRRPAMIVRASGTADVVRAVEFARDHDLPLSVHGGGHNVAGSAVVDDGLMLDLSAMRAVRVDPDARRVRAQGGALLGDIDHETQLHGLAVPFGVVSETGVAGLTLNGGYGHLSREHGLAADALRSAEVVLADGRVVTASPDDHADLFWALRGGGGRFGVVTEFEFEAYEVGPGVHRLFAWFPGDEAVAVFDAVREWAADAPREAAVLPFLAHVPELEEYPESAWGEPAVALFGCARGDRAPDETLAPLYDAATPLADLSGPTTWVELQSALDEDYPDGLRYYWKSTFVTDLTDEVVDLVVRANEAAPSALSTVDVWHLGGAVAEVPRDATAFWHREEPYMVNFEANWERVDDDEANVEWVREWFAALSALPVATGRYGNFPGDGTDPARLTFGGNYDRLVEVATRYDPEHVFRPNRSAPSAASGGDG